MSSEKRNKLSEIFKLAWQFVKRNGYKLSEALKCAWLNIKLKAEMKKRIVKFYFQKIDGSLREAYGITNCMESIIIKEIEMMLELPLHERQKAYFQDLLNAAKPVKIVPAADVLEDYELDYIRHVIKPKPKECYRNSHLLCEAFPERILYCEGKTNVPIPIDHAFNKVGDAYIDITFEFALHENPSIYEYVTFGEYDAKTIRKAVLETGYYGEIYKWLYYQSKK